MHLIALGLNHKTAALGLREKLAISPNHMVATSVEIMRCSDVNAVVLVSTCNRTEIYLEARSLRSVVRWLKQDRQMRANDLREYTYLYSDQDAVRHLMQVACGLDSMVLGEVEILGQLKFSYQLALQAGFVSKTLGKLFQAAFSVAKNVRTQTQIGVNPVSVAYLAVRLAERIFAHISEQTVLIVGAGDTARLLLKHLCSAGVTKFMVANRTIERSQTLINELPTNLSVELIDLSMLPDHLAHADIVVTAATAALPLIGKGMIESASKQRKHKPLFMIDLAVPCNIEPQVRDLSAVYLYAIDDLQSIAAEHKRYRHDAAQHAELIIDRAVESFQAWVESQQATTTIQAFRKLCEEQRDQCLDEANRLLRAGKDPYFVVQRLAHVMLNRLIHQPTVQMRTANARDDREILTTVRKLYNLSLEECPE